MEDGLNRYTLGRQIRSGPEGDVYEARDTKAGGRRVAITLIALEGKSSADVQAIRSMFGPGVDVTAPLNHPDVIQEIDKGIDDRRQVAFLVVPITEGESLKDVLIADIIQSPHRSAAIMVRALRAIGYCHGLGFVHQAIRPDNLTIGSDGAIKVAFFDRAGAVGRNRHGAVPGKTLEAAYYMSPEQFSDTAPVGPASDIWSCGVVLYEMLTGRKPFGGDTLSSVGQAVGTETAAPPSHSTRTIPPALDVAVLRALEKNPDKRFLTANEFADALEKALPPNRNAPRVSRWRSARLIGGVSACATALVLIAWYWLPAAGWWSPDRATAALPPQRPLEQQIAELPCSTVHAIPDGAPGNYVLHGLIAEGEPLGALNAITAGAGALRIRRDIQTFPASTAACRLAEVLRPITDQPGATGVELSTPTGERRLLFGQPFQFDVRMPNYNGFLWVDYLDADHNASHFEINGDGLPLFHQANQPVALGRNENGKYRYVLDSGPYGRDLVIALVASEALPGSALPKDEAGEFYVMQLEADIREWQNRGIKISAAAMVLETVGPGAGR